MAYTNVNDIRALSKITVAQVSDEDINRIIGNSTSEINSKVNVNIIREEIKWIDDVRTNDIDTSNQTFYIRNFKKFIADRNNDGFVDKEDIIVYKVLDNVETKLTVSSITFDEGKFVLSSAPEANSQLFITYSYSSYDQDSPDSLLNIASTYYSIAVAFLKKDAGVPTTVKFSSIRISRKLSDSYGVYWDKFEMVMQEINSKSVSGGYYAESLVKI